MLNDKACDDTSSADCGQIQNLPSKVQCSRSLTYDENRKKKGDFVKSERESVLERRRCRKVRRTAIKQKIRSSSQSVVSRIVPRSHSDCPESRKKGGLLDMVAGLTARTSALTRLDRQDTEDLRELTDFSVKPYYNDYSDHSTILIPPSLQVAESKWTLCYKSNVKREGGDPTRDLEDSDKPKNEGHIQLERSFTEMRFTKSRRLVRICILCVILIPLISAGMDDCGFVEKHLKMSKLRTMCIENNADVVRRRIVFMTIQLPISLIWFGSTFFKFYSDTLPWLPSIFVLIYGGCSIATTVFGKVPDSGIYMNYLFAVWLFIRIPFYSAHLISWITVLSYCVMRLATLPELAPGPPATKAIIDMVYLIVMNVVLTYAAYFWENTDRIEFIDTKVEAHVRANTQDLLNQIIPPAVQERIQSKNRGQLANSPGLVGCRGVIADEESEVSVLFSDIKGFTKFCSGVQAIDVVRALNTLYNRFDRKLEKLGVYKVETIGDAYFVSANCPIKAKDHARRLVQLGREMIQICSTFRPGGTKNENYKFEMRIGVHSGKVCAGVVGYKMPRYHLFGQTVTIAEVMESSGLPGKVQISEATKRYLERWEKESKERLGFRWISRGVREVLPEVMLETYFIQFPVY